MRLRILALLALAASCAFAQLNLTGTIAPSQVTTGQGTFNISLIPTGTTSSTVAVGNDSRFLNATAINSIATSSLSGIVKFSSGSPSNAAYGDVISLWSSCAAGTPLVRYDGTCQTAGGTGTVTSVGLSAPTIFNVGNTPVTSSGTLTLSFATGQTANYVVGTNGAGAVGLMALTGAMLPVPSTSVLGGVKAYTAVSNQFITSIDTTGTVASAQPSFANISGTASAAQLPTSTPVWNTYSVAYTNLSTAATTNAYTIVSLTARQMVCGVVEKTTTAFAGTSISGLTVTIGDSNGTSTFYSPTAYNLLATVSNTNFAANNVVGMASFGGGNIQVNATSTGANLSALSAGALSVSVCTVTLP